MNTANNILRSSAKRISVFSHAAMAPSNRAIMTQLDAVVTNSNTISPALPIHRWNIGRSYSISTSRMENVEDKPSVEVRTHLLETQNRTNYIMEYATLKGVRNTATVGAHQSQTITKGNKNRNT